MSVSTDNLENICRRAWIEGNKIDLTGCCYGPSFTDGQFVETPQSYQHFLAGFVRSEKLTHVLEIGTHFGGSIMSMGKGLQPQDHEQCKVVTVDVTCENTEGFKLFPYIKRIQGNALSQDTLVEVLQSFDKNIDLLYIDSTHVYEHVMLCLGLYANSLKPRFVIIDDIHFNRSMNRLWLKLAAEFKDKAFDATEISRRAPGGFGVIEWGNKTFNLTPLEKLHCEVFRICEGLLWMMPRPIGQKFRNIIGKRI